MSDDKSKPEPDGAKIIIVYDPEMRKWYRPLGVSEDALREAVHSVGNVAPDVGKRLEEQAKRNTETADEVDELKHLRDK